MSYQQGGSQWGPPQQPRPPVGWNAPPPKKSKLVPFLIGAACFVVTLVIIGAVAGAGKKSGGNSGTAAAPAAAPTATPTDQPAEATSAPAKHAAAPKPKAKPAPDQITYVVTGSAADVTYGPSGTDLSGRVPLHVTKQLGSPAYYAISAQLQGAGHVRCEILVKGKVASMGEASGSYNIASCEIVQDPFGGGWTDANAG